MELINLASSLRCVGVFLGLRLIENPSRNKQTTKHLCFFGFACFLVRDSCVLVRPVWLNGGFLQDFFSKACQLESGVCEIKDASIEP